MRVAAESLGAADRVHVVDTKTLSYGIGIMAMKASEMADAGASVDEIIATLESMAERVHVSFVVDTLTYLYRGGRCSGVAALAGNVLRIHPRIAVTDDGSLAPDHKYRGKLHHVIDAYMDDIMPHLETADPEYVAIVYSAGLDQKILDGVSASRRCIASKRSSSARLAVSSPATVARAHSAWAILTPNEKQTSEQERSGVFVCIAPRATL